LPVRDVDLAAPTSSTDVRVMANRGANGIDGVISSAAGVAASGAHPVVLSIGDLAVLHDLGGLAAVGRSKLALWVVVTDNSGGGIFDQLPIARLGAEVAFGQLFSTPHGTDLAVLDALPGLEVRPVADRRALTAALADMSGSAGGEAASPGVRLIHVAIDRESSRSQRTGLIEAVDRSLASIITGLGRADPT